MSDNIKINDLNLEGIKSELLNNLKETENVIDDLILPIQIPKNIVEEFNKRIINPANINYIIKICDY